MTINIEEINFEEIKINNKLTNEVMLCEGFRN